MRQFDRTALFIEACLKYGVMEANDSSNILFVGIVLCSLAATLTQTLEVQTQQGGVFSFFKADPGAVRRESPAVAASHCILSVPS